MLRLRKLGDVTTNSHAELWKRPEVLIHHTETACGGLRQGIFSRVPATASTATDAFMTIERIVFSVDPPSVPDEPAEEHAVIHVFHVFISLDGCSHHDNSIPT